MKRQPSNGVRIIGGQHRGRKIAFPDSPGLRPTGDRIRETLFNWLQPHVPGARCLDAFSGSGALGFEALSRGADRVVMLEQAGEAVTALRNSAALLDLPGAQIEQTDTLRWLAEHPVIPFDLLFLDPPFASDLLLPAVTLLEKRGWVRPGARIYTEAAANGPPLPTHWTPLRERTTGNVEYRLWERSVDAGAAVAR